jgi:hypothetical protein
MEADLASREELYELVWSMPMIKVAEKFDVSGSYMVRVCSTLVTKLASGGSGSAKKYAS